MTRGPGLILVVAGPCGAGKSTTAALLGSAFERSVHLQADHFTDFIVNGRTDDSDQHNVVGAAIGAASIQFALGGYAVLLDGTLLPEGVGGLAAWANRRDVAVHYAVLRPDLATCVERAAYRRASDPEDLDAFASLHARFSRLGNRESHVVDHRGTPDAVAATVLRAFRAGALAVENIPRLHGDATLT